MLSVSDKASVVDLAEFVGFDLLVMDRDMFENSGRVLDGTNLYDRGNEYGSFLGVGAWNCLTLHRLCFDDD